MLDTLKIRCIRFSNTLFPEEIKWLRGSVIDYVGKEQMLLHNHFGKGFRYAYPLVQYKIVENKACIIAINEGIACVDVNFLPYDKIPLTIGNRVVPMEVVSVKDDKKQLSFLNQPSLYHISRWTPLNSQNVNTYTTAGSLIEKIGILEKILIGNILSMAKGLGIFLEQQVECRIQEIQDTYTIRNKGIDMYSFDIVFTCNISLPDFIGLGKNASIGCGVVKHIQ